MQNFGVRSSTLDLNGPKIEVINNPSSVTTDSGGIATFTGFATATFPVGLPTEFATNTGSLAYNWYVEGYGALTDGSIVGLGLTGIVGSATTVLTVYGTSPDADGLNIFLRPDYVPSAYSVDGLDVTAGTARSTPNARNEAADSQSAVLTVNPVISIVSQPTDKVISETFDTTFEVEATTTNSTESSLSYQWSLNGEDISDGSTISGSNTDVLTISVASAGLNTVQCTVSHPTAGNSPIKSDVAKLDVSPLRSVINYELGGEGQTQIQETGSHDLVKGGRIGFRARSELSSRALVIYAPESDIDVKVTIGGCAGNGRNGHRGGEGGVSVFRVTLTKNTEYVVKLGSPSSGKGPEGGAPNGGGLSVIYRKAEVLAVAGGGGGAGTNARGGDGGGIDMAGENGQGRNPGRGGTRFNVGELPLEGSFQMDRRGQFNREFGNGRRLGGILSKCTIGNYYQKQGFSPCSDVGLQQGRTGTGSQIQGTATIQRGYKSGLGFRNNAGNASGNEGGGGGGAYGGDGGSASGSGGGGASGYSSGNIELISTQLGGNVGHGFISVEAWATREDDLPFIPEDSAQAVKWTIGREAAFSNTIVFVRESGTGPERITWGPNSGELTSQIAPGAVYVLENTFVNGSPGGKLRLQGNTLQLEDASDDDFNDLTVRPSSGSFTSASRYVA